MVKLQTVATKQTTVSTHRVEVEEGLGAEGIGEGWTKDKEKKEPHNYRSPG